MKSWFRSLFRVCRREFYVVTHDVGVMLFFVALPLFYPIAYTLIYNPELVEEVPFCVVDNSRTSSSRTLVQMADATQSMQLVGYASDMAEARSWLNEKACYGIMFIPEDYEVKIMQGEQAVVPFFYEMSLLMRYRTFVSALTDLQMAVGDECREKLMNEVGDISSELNVATIDSQAFMLGDESQGFASFVIPGILILILQQSMILGIAMLGGTSRDRQRLNNGVDSLTVEAPTVATILGKTLCYMLIYAPLTIYILHYVPILFDLPHSGSAVDYLLFIVPFLLSTAFMGFVMQIFVSERETAMLVVVFTSVIFLFLSGLTWPRYAMEFPWQQFGDIIPATWGIEGFVHINSNGATLSNASTPYVMLWRLTVIYFLLACVIQKRKGGCCVGGR